MFHTYTATRLFLHRVASEPGEWPAAVGDWPLLCEAASGLAAGIVQGTLHTPLYNVRLAAGGSRESGRVLGRVERVKTRLVLLVPRREKESSSSS